MQADMMAAQTQPQQGGMPPDQDEQGQGTPKAVIEVIIAQDGSITVELESGTQEVSEDNGDGGVTQGSQPEPEPSGSAPVQVKDIGEALQVIEKMYASVTQEPGAAKADQSSGYSSQ